VTLAGRIAAASALAALVVCIVVHVAFAFPRG
jgi:hypothetical protein